MLDDRENVYAQTEMAPRRQRSEPPATPLDGSATHVRSDPVYVLKAQLFRVLGHPVRIRILELLTDGERTVGDLQDALSLDSSGTSHGVPYNYDNHVPVIFFGPGIKPGTYRETIAVNDIAPTLAALLGTTEPSGSIGRVLTEIIQ